METWYEHNTFHHSQFSDIERLVALKKEQGLKISVALPTLNEENTIAKEIVLIKSELMERHKLVDELAVIDSGSSDDTKEISNRFKADVYLSEEILPDMGSYKGKGENLWKALYVLKGDIIVYIDADIKNIHPKFVYGLVGPLLENEEIGYVKAFYRRPITRGIKTFPSGGGRVTQILVRPLFNAFFPKLSGLVQPLSGEYASRRKILEGVPFFIGYGVETGLLIDIFNKFGLDAIAQVDMDRRVHRNQGILGLGRMSYGILQTFMNRAEALGRLKISDEIPVLFKQMVEKNGKRNFKEFEIREVERPPMITVDAYRKKRGL